MWVAKIIQELWSLIGLGKPMVVWMFWGSPVSKTPMVCWVGGGKPSSPVCPVCPVCMATAFASRFPAVVLTCGPLLWMPQCDVKGTGSRIRQCTRFARMESDGNDFWQLLRFLMNTHDNSRAPMSQSDFGCWGFLSSFQPSCSTEAWLIWLPLATGGRTLSSVSDLNYKTQEAHVVNETRSHTKKPPLTGVFISWLLGSLHYSLWNFLW